MMFKQTYINQTVFSLIDRRDTWIIEKICSYKKGLQKYSSLRILKTRRKYIMNPSEMAFSSNFRWQTRKERPNRPTNNGDMSERTKRPLNDRRSESVTSI